MANQETKEPGTNEFTGLVAVLVLFFSAVWVDYTPLKTSRPLPEEIPSLSKTGVIARLWQDPFAAVQRERAKPLIQLRDGGCETGKLPGDLLQEKVKDMGTKVIALGAMIQEASWESVEELQGRRQRYAVLAALNHQGYVPDHEDRLHCLKAPIPVTRSMQSQDYPVIPYELFTKTELDGKKSQAVLFWLDELSFSNKPLQEIRWLFHSAAVEIGVIKILGPWASGTVKSLVAESQELDDKTLLLLPRNRLIFLSSSATAADRELLPFNHRDQALTEFLDSKGIFFERFTTTDDKIVRSLIEELTLRGLDTETVKAGESNIALISEWDTLYAQTLPETFKRELSVQEQCKNNGDECPILLFSYLRGLDGLLPGKEDANGDRQGQNIKEPKKNGSAIEHPEGDSQVDYLRRLMDRLYDQEKRLLNQGKELKAIGVFGNDIYDKLLVLKALRSRFPSKIVFTTDLDAAYLHPDEFKSVTHNLILASAFGLTLSPSLQGSIPPFRDTYQTGTFLATQVALSMDQFGETIEKQRIEINKKTKEWFRKKDVLEKGSGRIFEIGRTRAINLNDSAEGQFSRCSSVLDCQSVHPVSEPEMGELSDPRDKVSHLAKLQIGMILMLTFLWLLLCLLWRSARRRTRSIWIWLRYHPVTGMIGFAGLVASVILMNYLAFFAKGEEPFSWLDGVSMWPAEIIRLATLLLTIIFIRRGWLLIRWNDFTVSKRFFPDTWRNAIAPREVAKQSLLDLSKGYWRELIPTKKFAPQCPREIWIEHIQPRVFWARFIRAIVPAVVFLMTGAIGFSLLGPPDRPYRGDVFGKLDIVILFSTLFTVQVLIFFVADATARCNRMAQQLLIKATNWPHATLAAWGLTNSAAESNASWTIRGEHCGSIFDPFVDMQLIAERTNVLSKLIYYPFFALALFVVSRTPLFDNWHTPWQLGLLFLLSFTIPVICALRLRYNAEELRKTALEKLSQFMLAQKCSGDSKKVELLEEAIKQIEAVDKGAFKPFTKQPWLKALFLPLSSWSGLTIIEFLINSNF